MPIFIGAFFALIGSLIVRAFKFITVRFGLVVTLIASVTALLAAFYLAIWVLASGLNLIIPSEFVELASMFIPTNLKLLISIVMAVKTTVVYYAWAIRFREYVLLSSP